MDNFMKYEFKKIPNDKLIENLMIFFEKMSKRRTVREFSDEDIPEEVVLKIIEAAATAPSGANKQPWFFYVVKDKNIKRKIREEAEKIELKNYSKRFTDVMKQDLNILRTNANKPFLEIAPYLIVVCKEKYEIIDGKKRKNYYVNESVGIALGFLIAAIHFAGLATVTYTPNPMHFVKVLLNIPENLSPIAILPVGYPKAGAEIPILHKKPLDKFIKIV